MYKAGLGEARLGGARPGLARHGKEEGRANNSALLFLSCVFLVILEK
jgi:hypothetical protein